MVLLGRAILCFHRLSLQITIVSVIVWPQFAMKVVTGGCKLQVWGKGWSQGVGDGPLLSTQVVTSYRFPIVIVSLSLTFLQCSDLSRTDGRNWSTIGRHY